MKSVIKRYRLAKFSFYFLSILFLVEFLSAYFLADFNVNENIIGFTANLLSFIINIICLIGLYKGKKRLIIFAKYWAISAFVFFILLPWIMHPSTEYPIPRLILSLFDIPYLLAYLSLRKAAVDH